MVAEDTKDFFYTHNKPKYLSCELSRIDYSDNFTKANAVMLCEQYIMMPGFADHPMKVPTPSAWKVENGKWYWYVDQDALRNTPWGRMTPGAFPEKGAPAPPPSLASIPTTADFVFKQIQLDKNAVRLKAGESAEVTISNRAPGPMARVIVRRPCPVLRPSWTSPPFRQAARPSSRCAPPRERNPASSMFKSNRPCNCSPFRSPSSSNRCRLEGWPPPS